MQTIYNRELHEGIKNALRNDRVGNQNENSTILTQDQETQAIDVGQLAMNKDCKTALQENYVLIQDLVEALLKSGKKPSYEMMFQISRVLEYDEKLIERLALLVAS